MTSKLNELSQAGWQLIHIASATESDAGKGDGTGIYVT